MVIYLSSADIRNMREYVIQDLLLYGLIVEDFGQLISLMSILLICG